MNGMSIMLMAFSSRIARGPPILCGQAPVPGGTGGPRPFIIGRAPAATCAGSLGSASVREPVAPSRIAVPSPRYGIYNHIYAQFNSISFNNIYSI